MTARVCGDLTSIAELNQGSVPALHLDVGPAKDLSDDVWGLFRIERRSRISVRHQLGVVPTATGAHSEKTTPRQDASCLGKASSRVIDVVEHPKHRDGANAVVSEWQPNCVTSQNWPMRAVRELARRFIQTDPPHAA